MIGRRICLITIYLLKVLTVICDPIPVSSLHVKAMISLISDTNDFEPNILAKRCGLYTSFYGNQQERIKRYDSYNKKILFNHCIILGFHFINFNDLCHSKQK